MRSGLRKQAQTDTFIKVDVDFKVDTASGWKMSTALAALNVTRKAIVTVTVYPGVHVGNLNFDSAPTDSHVFLVNKGMIVGNSGGGDALNVGFLTDIDNQGTIAGGGGRGGNGGNGSTGGFANWTCNYGTVVPAGAGGRGAGMQGAVFVDAQDGIAGTQAADSGAKGGTGGRGGDIGFDGAPGTPGFVGHSWQGGTVTGPDGKPTYYPACGPYLGPIANYGAAGQVSGRAIVGIAKVKFTKRGAVLGLTV